MHSHRFPPRIILWRDFLCQYITIDNSERYIKTDWIFYCINRYNSITQFYSQPDHILCKCMQCVFSQAERFFCTSPKETLKPPKGYMWTKYKFVPPSGIIQFLPCMWPQTAPLYTTKAFGVLIGWWNHLGLGCIPISTFPTIQGWEAGTASLCCCPVQSLCPELCGAWPKVLWLTLSLMTPWCWTLPFGLFHFFS